MQYDKNNPKKQRQLWERTTQNKINVDDLKKAGIKVRSLIYDKGIYKYQGEPTDEWQSWIGLQPFIDITVYELKEFTEEMIPYLDCQLITKVVEDSNGNINQELLEILEAKLKATQDYWQYTYVIKAEEDTTSSSAQQYKEENGIYPVTYYLISYIIVHFWGDDVETLDAQVLNYKQVITINNPKFDEITKDKK